MALAADPGRDAEQMGESKALGKTRRRVSKALLDHRNADAKDIHDLLETPPRESLATDTTRERKRKKEREASKQKQWTENPARHRGLGIPKWLLDQAIGTPVADVPTEPGLTPPGGMIPVRRTTAPNGHDNTACPQAPPSEEGGRASIVCVFGGP